MAVQPARDIARGCRLQAACTPLSSPESTSHTGSMREVAGWLEQTPRILRLMLRASGEAEYLWKPSPSRWSIAEVLGHLCHVEKLGFRRRVERIMNEDNPLLENYDHNAFAAAGAYSGRTLEDALTEFERERAESLELLRTLPVDAAARPGRHAELGPLTLGHLIHEWPFHDLGHVRQIAELLRAAKYYPHMGPWQKFYTINP